MRTFKSVSILVLASSLALAAFAQTQPASRGGGIVGALPGPPAPAAAQMPAASMVDIPALRVAVTQVSDSRNSQGSGRVTLTLGISGEGLPTTAVVRQVIITKAVDNNDRVIPPSPMSMGSIGMMNSIGQSAPSAVMRASAYLGAVVRSAESLKFVEGTIDIFVPSEANGSIIRLSNIKSHPGRVENPVLAKYGIAFHFLGDKESADEARAQLSSSGMGSSSSMNIEMNSVTAIGYFYRDPSSKLAGYQLLDGTGVMLRTGGGGGISSSTMSYTTSTLQTPLPDDAQLAIYVATPEAMKTVPFRVEDVMLP